MTHTDGFVEVKPGFLVDPAARYSLSTFVSQMVGSAIRASSASRIEATY